MLQQQWSRQSSAERRRKVKVDVWAVESVIAQGMLLGSMQKKELNAMWAMDVKERRLKVQQKV